MPVLAACTAGERTAAPTASSAPTTTVAPSTSAPSLPAPVATVMALARDGSWRATGDDRIEVWICHVPQGSTAVAYGGLPLRLPLTPEGVAAVVEAHVTPYFETISHGRYRPEFVAGGEYEMAATDEPSACVDAAVAGAGAGTRAVLAVADAEQAEGQSGGFGTDGQPCPAAPPCDVGESHRAVYVGASDFHPDWGDRPPMDLVEHELGHTLGWVHSGYDATAPQPYLSALDLMSNSAAPRDVDGDRRDGPDVLALSRLLAGWLPIDDLVVADGDVTTDLVASTGERGTRLVVLPVDDTSFLTVEVLTADGFDAHLPASGVAVHRVTVLDGVVQPLQPLVGDAPFTALLAAGDEVVSDGWRIVVAGEWHVTATSTAT